MAMSLWAKWAAPAADFHCAGSKQVSFDEPAQSGVIVPTPTLTRVIVKEHQYCGNKAQHGSGEQTRNVEGNKKENRQNVDNEPAPKNLSTIKQNMSRPPSPKPFRPFEFGPVDCIRRDRASFKQIARRKIGVAVSLARKNLIQKPGHTAS